MNAILYGILSALTWGAADFAGGLASRRTSPYKVVALGWIIGLLILPVIAILKNEPMISLRSALWCLAAGGFGAFGILIFYYSLSIGRMSLAAPISAVLAAAIPVLIGVFLDGMPGLQILLAFLFAFVSVVLVSNQETLSTSLNIKFSEIKIPMLAGITFGLYFVLMHQGSQEGLFWPMTMSHVSGVILLLLAMIIQKKSLIPARSDLFLILSCFVLDQTGTLFYILAGQAGRMDVAAVLASLYPGITILMAWGFLKEHISKPQLAGIGLSLIAIVLFSI